MTRWWLDRSLRSKGVLVLALPLAMLVTTAAAFFLADAQASAAQRGVNQTRQVTADLDRLQASVVDGETGIRAFLATGDDSFLEPTDIARVRTREIVERLQRSVAGDPAQAARMHQVQQELDRGFQSRPPDNIGPASGAEVRRTWVADQKASTDAIRAMLAELGVAEEQRLAAGLVARDAWRSRTRLATGTALAVGLAFGLASMFAFTHGIARRLERLDVGSRDLRLGQTPGLADPGGDEIGVLSRRLEEVTTRWLLWQQEAGLARASAEQASQAKNEFLSRMSHELRTPLNAVLGFAQLLEMDLPNEQREPVAQIRRAGRHLLTLINEVLDISKIESGHLTLSPESVKVSDLIEEAVELMAPIAAAHDVRLQAAPAAACVCHVQADRQRAKQVLLNLMSNAVKYNRPGGTVRVHCRQDGPATSAIEVEDNGLGISEHDLDRLFVPFQRLAAAGTDIEGTGVGLALSQRLATAMDGRIEVRSTLGEGSTFTIVLPLTDPPPTPIPAQPGPDRAPPLPAAQDAGGTAALTVLSIEDNLANTRLLEQIIDRRPAWRLVSAAHGQLGLDLATADTPQLILLDLHLPDMPGQHVLRRLKATPETRDIPVIVVSADATPGLVKRLRAAGAAGYLTKPIDVAQILTLLDDAAAVGSSPPEAGR